MDPEYISLIIVLTGIIIAFELEATHDKIVSSFPQSKEDGDRWHRVDWFYIATLSIVIAYLYKGVSPESGVLLLNIIGLRMTYFPIRFNNKRGSEWDYLGKGRFDSFVKKLFRDQNSLYFLSAIVLTVASIILSFLLIIL